MDNAISNLPAWAIFSLGVVWLTFQFVQKFLEWAAKRREAEALAEYRRKRKSQAPSGEYVAAKPSAAGALTDEGTGRHDLRSVLDNERARDQRQEILLTSRQHGELLQRLVAAEGQQTALLQRIVETQEAQAQTLRELALTQRSFATLLGRSATAPSLRVTAREEG